MKHETHIAGASKDIQAGKNDLVAGARTDYRDRQGWRSRLTGHYRDDQALSCEGQSHARRAGDAAIPRNCMKQL